ncbi:MAG TPA: Rab family GTPase [Candidatus Lokiarchaeia archaeon]|nr:Rab family GTPase [Candidatus Lokiarchaeia archaeon]
MELKAKVTVLGDNGVGKTSLILRYVRNEFTETYKPTLGADFMVKKLEIEDHPGDSITLAIWDLAGQEDFTQLHDYYLVGTVAAIICFDITDRSTFEHVPNWIAEIKKICGDIPYILVGTKRDLEDERQVTEDEMTIFADSVRPSSVCCFETSSRTYVNINELFQYIVDNYLCN